MHMIAFGLFILAWGGDLSSGAFSRIRISYTQKAKNWLPLSKEDNGI